MLPIDILYLISGYLPFKEIILWRLIFRLNNCICHDICDIEFIKKFGNLQSNNVYVQCKYSLDNYENKNSIKHLTLGQQQCNDIIDSKKLRYIYSLHNLVSFSFPSVSYITNRYIKPLINLTKLDCSNTKITEVNTLTNLTHLNCSNTKVKNIKDLVNLTHLNCYKSGITNITTLTKLTDLSILKLNNIEDKIASNLINLNCSFSRCIDISKFVNLQKLSCVQSDINYINLYNLTHLVCNHTKITDISKLINLLYLECSNTKIIDVNSLTNLTYLDCSDTKIINVSSLTNLTYLNCSNTNINNISSLTKLKYLDFSYSRIKDISHIEHIEHVICKHITTKKSYLSHYNK